MTEQIAFYGKGGVGKSTLISNISAALVEAGFKVLQIGEETAIVNRRSSSLMGMNL